MALTHRMLVFFNWC